MEQPDITPTEARNAALIAAFKGLDAILSNGGFEMASWSVGVTDEGLSLNLGQFVSCRGDGQVEYGDVFFTWDELSDPDLFLGPIAQTRWDENRAESERIARHAAEVEEREKKERVRRAAQEAAEKRAEYDRAELRRLMAAYPAEVKSRAVCQPAYHRTMKPLAPRTLCADGTILSVQASRYHYCSPREDEGPYDCVEVGFIRDATGAQIAPPEDWREYGDGCFPSDVYGYVPVELVEAFIAEHGGRAATS